MNNPKITPLEDRVVILPAPTPDKTKGGLIIPDVARERPSEGEVVAIGTGKNNEPMTVKHGDRVLYGKNTGVELVIDEVAYLLMRETDLYAIL